MTHGTQWSRYSPGTAAKKRGSHDITLISQCMQAIIKYSHGALEFTGALLPALADGKELAIIHLQCSQALAHQKAVMLQVDQSIQTLIR
ncbi:hypothetical protein UU5_18947 [Rhodanobacter sp. 115]|nr:hypothetical protein UU5_18947 [Rhodanobacter sp. 115]